MGGAVPPVYVTLGYLYFISIYSYSIPIRDSFLIILYTVLTSHKISGHHQRFYLSHLAKNVFKCFSNIDVARDSSVDIVIRFSTAGSRRHG